MIQQLWSPFLKNMPFCYRASISSYFRHLCCLRNRLLIFSLFPIYPLAEVRKKSLAMKLQTHVSINFLFEKFQSCFIREQRLCWGKPIMISLFQAYSRIASILGFCLDLSQLSYRWSCCFSNPPWTSVGSFWGCIILFFFFLLCIPLLSAGCYSWFFIFQSTFYFF